jgi:hypothetical protein
MPPRNYTVTSENRCQATTVAGNRCKRPRQSPRPFCQNHPDESQVHPDVAGQLAGNGNGGGGAPELDIPDNPTAADVARIGAQAAGKIMRGEMTPQMGASVSKLLEMSLKAIEKAVPDDRDQVPVGSAPPADEDPYQGAPPVEEPE